MTQLLIAGVEVTLPQNFTVTVKRENSFFTKNGEYTYDCTLNLDNPVNRTLYGFLQRINKAEQLDTHRSAVLIADGHVYARGSEIVTRWTNETVTIQIVSGESELNYFAGQDKMIEELDALGIGNECTTETWMQIRSRMLKHTADIDNGTNYCLPPIWAADGTIVNWRRDSGYEVIWPQPYVKPLLEWLFRAMGYSSVDMQAMVRLHYDYLFFTNTLHTKDYRRMFAGWKVLDLLTAIEQLTGLTFVVNTTQNLVTAIPKSTYFEDAKQLTLQNVVDQYEAEQMDADSQADEDWTSSNIRYNFPDTKDAKLMALPEGVLLDSTIRECADINAVLAAIAEPGTTEHIIYKDMSTDRCYIEAYRQVSDMRVVPVTNPTTGELLYYTFDIIRVRDGYKAVEVNMFAELKHGEGLPEIEIAITPAPMRMMYTMGCEIIDLRNVSTASSDEEEEQQDESYEDFISGYSETEASKRDIYAAFFCGVYDYMPVAYTDSYRAYLMFKTYGYTIVDSPTDPSDRSFYGSLRLPDIDSEVYAGGYQIDTAKAYTFETYDPNVIDPRQVYVIRNRRYVVHDVEETITTEGRQKKWKLTCYPIKITDTSIEHRWILTDGVWDDGGAWLDDGRWLDGE